MASLAGPVLVTSAAAGAWRITRGSRVIAGMTILGLVIASWLILQPEYARIAQFVSRDGALDTCSKDLGLDDIGFGCACIIAAVGALFSGQMLRDMPDVRAA